MNVKFSNFEQRVHNSRERESMRKVGIILLSDVSVLSTILIAKGKEGKIRLTSQKQRWSLIWGKMDNYLFT